jgi:hypothetical protein
MKEDEMGRACSEHNKDEKYIKNVSWEAWNEDTTRKIWA